ncbi:MAG TPA: PadR family transcriptional regulator [Acidimicrobiales bacterium]|nr:PadR family transcriptional regulator [Acidimicrobiales bacterium]
MWAATADEMWPGPSFALTWWDAARRHRHESGDEGRGASRRRGHRRGGPARGWGGQDFGGWWSGWGGGRPRPRPRRGDVRLAVLMLLAEEPMHGYQIITELTERSEGTWRPSPGSVYPTLQQLEDEGLVVASERDGRRTYSLTDTGRRTLEELPPGRSAPWEEMAAEPDDAVKRLRRRIAQVAAASMQVGAGGTRQQVDQAEQVLADAQRSLYRILSEDPGDPDDPDDQAPGADAGTRER